MSSCTVTAFKWVPPFAQGLVRDLRVRWALEEAGRKYNAQLIGLEERDSESYRKHQPFGQVPVFKEDDLELFETGAIVMHVAEGCDALMPEDSKQRAQVKTWVFAALNSVEPPIMMLNVMDLSGKAAEGAKELREVIMKRIQSRLESLAGFLGEREYLVGDRFTAADLMMTSVLRILRTTDLVTKIKTLHAYQSRGEARPAFQRALAAQLAAFAQNAPEGKK